MKSYLVIQHNYICESICFNQLINSKKYISSNPICESDFISIYIYDCDIIEFAFDDIDIESHRIKSDELKPNDKFYSFEIKSTSNESAIEYQTIIDDYNSIMNGCVDYDDKQIKTIKKQYNNL